MIGYQSSSESSVKVYVYTQVQDLFNEGIHHRGLLSLEQGYLGPGQLENRVLELER
jgi:hypothetical protein